MIFLKKFKNKFFKQQNSKTILQTDTPSSWEFWIPKDNIKI